MKRLATYFIMFMLLTVIFVACSKTENFERTSILENEIEITSTSLNSEGKWKTVITSSDGENKTPQLSWSPVESASCYAIYMFDITAGNWCHWIAKDVKVTELELGAKLEDSQYIGPYPPSGVHTYEVRIFALKDSPDSYSGRFDNVNPSLDDIIKALDTSKGKTGNVLATGVLRGTYKTGDIVE